MGLNGRLAEWFSFARSERQSAAVRLAPAVHEAESEAFVPRIPFAPARFLLLASRWEADKQPPPDVLAIAGASVLVFHKA
jgi:hypothetical protein